MIKIKQLAFITVLIFSCACPLYADVASPSDYYDGGVSTSIEGIFSLEYPFSHKSSLLFWLGGAFVNAISDRSLEDYNPTYGIESSLELRFYPVGSERIKIFTGIYTGIGYIRGPIPYHHIYDIDRHKTYFIQSFGAKIGYKIVALDRGYATSSLRLVFEPYMSGSVTYYYSSMNGHESAEFFVWNAPWFNLGLRVVFEYCIK